MAKYTKTAKDLAWDREREKYRRIIAQKDEDIRKYIIEIQSKESVIDYYESLLDRASMEIKSLKALLELPKDVVEEFLKNEAEKADRERKGQEAVESLKSLLSFGGHYI